MNDDWLYHNSHDEFFRSPFGAVCCGTGITLRLRVSKGNLPDAVKLRLWREDAGEEYCLMEPIRQLDGEWVYQIQINTPETPGLLWYYFQIIHDGDISYYGADHRGYGGTGQYYAGNPVSYQITVYPASLATPRWFKEAIVYQIFVDRFCNGKEEGKIEGLRPGSLIHAYWQDTPFYVRDMRTGHIFAYDFFGGNLSGVLAKLSYLKELGVTTIYCNPIFEAPSNHKYDTGDYKKVDPMFGDNALLKELCTKASSQGIGIILDGVFSHTGSDSIYFNKEGNYPGLGAYQSADSPYFHWYRFSHYPEKYDSWWGIGTLPNVNELEPAYLDFIMYDEDSVINHWFAHGIRGWRLDVADELPDLFIKKLRQAMKKKEPESILIGEVWEDASRKQSYGITRQYFWGDELDSVTNYPFRAILLDFMLEFCGADDTRRKLTSLYENYPREHFYSTLNILGSHDVPRILTLLGEAPSPEGMTIIEQANYRLEPDKRRLAIDRLKLLALWQLTFPGVPCIYYGDEAGVEGYTDPFNRGTYPWGNEDTELLAWYKRLTGLRQQYAVLRTGDWNSLPAGDNVYCYARRITGGRDVFGQACSNNAAVVLINRSRFNSQPVTVDLSDCCRDYLYDAIDQTRVPLTGGRLEVVLQPLEGKLYLQNLTEGSPVERSSGVLLHPTSLPTRYGIGDLGPKAHAFVDWLAASGQKAWQILPLNPPGYGESPYQCYSAFAGNPLLISPEDLVAAGLLEAADISNPPSFPETKVEYERVKQYKNSLLQKAFSRFSKQQKFADYETFLAENDSWLDNYALFMALKERFQEKAWHTWEPAIALRSSKAVQHYAEQFSDQMDYHRFLQYTFFRQWEKLKNHAKHKGVQIIGDLPIFVSAESSDVWSNPHLFELDAKGQPAAVAGVPPDYFSKTGQLWGNPHYNWSVMAADGYSWWQERVRRLLKQVDLIRIDHFRGFDAFWKIPADKDTAMTGEWVSGPGAYFFAELEKDLGKMPIIAEDLGVITRSVELLRDMFNFPGMKVLQFLFESGSAVVNQENVIVYSGTHDNDTTLGWYRKCDSYTAETVQKTLGLTDGCSEQELCWGMIEYAMASPAGMVITPLQDILCLDSDARMNIPGTVGGNWEWRCPEDKLTPSLADRLSHVTSKYRR